MKSGEVEVGVRVTGKNTELVKIISTIANTNGMGHFEIIIFPITLFLVAVSLILVCFHHGRAPLQHLRGVEDARVLRRVVVASIPIAMQVVCTSTMVLSCLA